MISRQATIIGGLAAIAALIVWILFAGLPRWVTWPIEASGRRGAVPSSAVTPPGRKIKASLFYVSDDGMRLTPVERDVPFGEGTVEQARQIIEAQIAAAAEPLVTAVPMGTRLRTIFVTPNGEAFRRFQPRAGDRPLGRVDQRVADGVYPRQRALREPSGSPLGPSDLYRRRQAGGHPRRSCRPETATREKPRLGTMKTHHDEI